MTRDPLELPLSKFDMSGPFDRQALFDKAYLGLASQGFKRSTSEGVHGLCLYRAPNGAKCALGWLIPDDKYNPDMEARTARDLVVGLDYDDLDWLRGLQIVHDTGPGAMQSMQERLGNYAERHGLTVPTIPTSEPVAA